MRRTGIAIGFFLLFLCAPCCARSLEPFGRYQESQEKLFQARTELQRFYALRDAAKTSLSMGKYDQAEKYARELLSLAPQYRGNWNYGNAIHDSHMVLGRVALHKGNVDEAKEHLLQAGRTPGSPQLDSFGPNMSLAKELLEKGEKDVVIQYLDLCGAFWKNERGRLEIWKREIERDRVPDFGANLLY